jgi:hypothetical protein
MFNVDTVINFVKQVHEASDQEWDALPKSFQDTLNNLVFSVGAYIKRRDRKNRVGPRMFVEGDI